MSYSALRPSACNLGVTARIPSRPTLLSSDSVAVKLLNTLDSINILVLSYQKFFSQINILTMVSFGCLVFSELLSIRFYAAVLAQVVCVSIALSLWFLLVICQYGDNWFCFLFLIFLFLTSWILFHLSEIWLSLWIPWNLCCRSVR